MTHIEALIVIEIIQHPVADEADRMVMFLKQFPHHATLAKEQWEYRYGEPWQD